MSLMMHRLLLYPDHPFDIGEIRGKRFNPQAKHYESFLVTEAPDLAKEVVYPKECRLIEDIRQELRQGRRCQVYATFTGEFDVAARLDSVLRCAGMRVAVLRPSVPTLKRELWYEKQLKEGVEVVICHPKLVETGLDLLAFPTLYFYETGYSLHTLRQASRRSWRIGQRHPVRVKFVVSKGTTQITCLRLMGKKMLVALMMEGKFSGAGIHSLESDLSCEHGSLGGRHERYRHRYTSRSGYCPDSLTNISRSSRSLPTVKDGRSTGPSGAHWPSQKPAFVARAAKCTSIAVASGTLSPCADACHRQSSSRVRPHRGAFSSWAQARFP